MGDSFVNERGSKKIFYFFAKKSKKDVDNHVGGC